MCTAKLTTAALKANAHRSDICRNVDNIIDPLPTNRRPRWRARLVKSVPDFQVEAALHSQERKMTDQVKRGSSKLARGTINLPRVSHAPTPNISRFSTSVRNPAPPILAQRLA